MNRFDQVKIFRTLLPFKKKIDGKEFTYIEIAVIFVHYSSTKQDKITVPKRGYINIFFLKEIVSKVFAMKRNTEMKVVIYLCTKK